ncbi:hypothetical protein BT67DRAFT_220364 [Trichocladium antarcticum]|uniref:Uncharacterized protein n=1 Tax=Trichocladium antarcticum TaxID=1450529 RepID=A0AAN6UF31_9PEZI|nr:hypothetical protein BT67DRAFT_220364 [Trichocladium antarcticum]
MANPAGAAVGLSFCLAVVSLTVWWWWQWGSWQILQGAGRLCDGQDLLDFVNMDPRQIYPHTSSPISWVNSFEM